MPVQAVPDKRALLGYIPAEVTACTIRQNNRCWPRTAGGRGENVQQKSPCLVCNQIWRSGICTIRPSSASVTLI
ncbi:hypothetical protein MNBD_ALPHA07-1916, partial [hydrothermal vent metagenome]